MPKQTDKGLGEMSKFIRWGQSTVNGIVIKDTVVLHPLGILLILYVLIERGIIMALILTLLIAGGIACKYGMYKERKNG